MGGKHPREKFAGAEHPLAPANIRPWAEYSQEVDKLILDYIEKCGNCKDAYNRLCQEFQRSLNSVRKRSNLLSKKYLDRKAESKIDKDEVLAKSVLQVRNSILLQDMHR